MKMKFNLEKHLKKHNIFGVGIGYIDLPKELQNLLTDDGFVKKENLKETTSFLYLESFKFIEENQLHQKNLEEKILLKGTILHNDIYIILKTNEYKVKRISKAIRKIERFYL